MDKATEDNKGSEEGKATGEKKVGETVPTEEKKAAEEGEAAEEKKAAGEEKKLSKSQKKKAKTKARKAKATEEEANFDEELKWCIEQITLGIECNKLTKEQCILLLHYTV